ncbi:hypothetical protein EMCRGX_G010081 [Ephydatia muelleri]
MGSGWGSEKCRLRPADVLIPNWSLGKPVAPDLSVASPLNVEILSEARCLLDVFWNDLVPIHSQLLGVQTDQLAESGNPEGQVHSWDIGDKPLDFHLNSQKD